MRLLPLCLLVLVGVQAKGLAQAPASSAGRLPQIEQVAPGVWRLRVGTPEKLTPASLRSALPRLDALREMPESSLPFDPQSITYTASAARCTVQLPLEDEERLYGFGLNGNLFEMTSTDPKHHPGRHVFLRPTDDPENDLNDSHAPVPLYWSSRGYGVYVDTARYASFYTGNVADASKGASRSDNRPAGLSPTELYASRPVAHKSVLADVPGTAGVDVYLFGGPTLAQAVGRYVLFSGGGAVPPLWGLGVAYRGYSPYTAEDTLKLAASFRDQHLPCDVWGLEPGWQSHAYSCSFVWNEKNFPQPADFVGKMTALGYHLNAWEHCFTAESSPIHARLQPLSGNHLVWGGLVPDFALPEAKSVFQELQEQSLFSLGIDGVKLDECDNQPSNATPWSFPEASRFPSGLDGEQMHSLLGVLYQQTEWEPLRRRNLRTWGLVRQSQALAAPLPYSLYSDTYKERAYVRALAKEGFSGLLWTPEVREAKSLEELYRRVEAGLFAPQLLVNCWYMKQPPWFQIDRQKNQAGEAMPEQAEATATIKRLFELRMSFVPYLYAAFNEYHLHGTPPVRALVLDWPEDPATHFVDDEFMVGPAVLAAPIFSGERGRKVYLPHGDWYDYWTGQKLTGGQTLEVSKGLDQLPIYVKAGTLLPLAKPVEHLAPDTCLEITVRVYGDGAAGAALYEDDGVSYDFEQGKQNQIDLKWNGTEVVQQSSGGYRGPARYKLVGSTVVP